jgi:hypothetical protein
METAEFSSTTVPNYDRHNLRCVFRKAEAIPAFIVASPLVENNR